MLNVYDILLNLLDSEYVYEFFEWSNKDDVEHIKKIPMIKITSNCLDSFINDTVIIDKEFLTTIYQKTEVFNPDRIGVIDYACLFTDGYKVLGIEFNKEGKSLFKSFLLLDEEEEVLEVSLRLQEEPLAYNIESQNIPTDLTRYDQTLKDYVLKDIRESYRKGDVAKLKYLYYEYFNKEGYDIEKIYKELMQSLDNFNSKHYNLYQLIKLC